MAVFTVLVHLLLTDYAFGISIRSPPALLGEELILVDLAAAALEGVAGALLPLVRDDHFPQFI